MQSRTTTQQTEQEIRRICVHCEQTFTVKPWEPDSPYCTGRCRRAASREYPRR
jgi:endogenous inhibitor of DNA gyrase (YacG/DUF329 family)